MKKSREDTLLLNGIWSVMILVSVVYGAFTGRLGAVTEGALSGAEDAVNLCITMAGVIGLWMGLMEIAKRSGIISGITRTLLPVLRFLFPKIPSGHPALEYIAVNVTANILGLGWAATPAGLKAMEELAALKREGEKNKNGQLQDKICNYKNCHGIKQKGDEQKDTHLDIASNEMCIFLIMNISSLQLIPVNIIAYRSQYGSRNPAVIIVPAILATLISTLTAVIFCKIMDMGKKG